MNIVVTGSLGHISKPLTLQLVNAGHAVTVISSNPEKQKDIEALGANAAIGTLEDAAFLTATFTGADAVYTMIPPNNYTDHALDLTAYVKCVAGNYAQAIVQSDIKRVVHLSSIGAHLDKGSGIILAHHAVENILNKLENVDITFMRPTAFHYNLNAYMPAIKHAGVMAANYGADDPIVWVSPTDIAAAIADEITTPTTGQKVRYVASNELTCNEVAGILGTAIGKPDLQWALISGEQVLSNLLAYGINPEIAAGLVEMQDCMHDGAFFEDYYKNRPAMMGTVSMTDFAQDFAAAYAQFNAA